MTQFSDHDAVPDEQIHESSESSWIAGFTDIIIAPQELAVRRIDHPMRPFFFATLLSTLAVVIVSFLMSSNDILRQQLYDLQWSPTEKVLRAKGVPDSKIEEISDEMRKGLDFSLIRAIGGGFARSLVSISLMGVLLWVMIRLFQSEPPPTSVIIGMASYGTTISALGTVLMCLGQFSMNNLHAVPSPSAFINAQEHSALYLAGSMFNVFSVWEYLVVGMVCGLHARLSARQGMIYGFILLCLNASIVGGFTWMWGKIMGA
jgi:hypothetical protein